MLTKLKEILGSGAASQGGARRGRIDIDRRFVIVADVTGQGSMSKVYRVLDNEQGRTVCLKVQDRDKNAAAAARTGHDERPPEGAIGYAIVHPNVVRTFEYGVTTRDQQYMVMEYVDGVSLQHVRQTIRLNLRGRLKLLIQAAEGLGAVHDAGFIHHDINPRNILVNKENTVKLIDFGLAVPNTPAFRKPGNRTGALPYMAPELIRREPIDEKIDIFAYGALAFEFLTNRLPYDAPGGNSMAMMLQRINHDPLDPAEANPKLPASLCDVLRKSLARRREDRYASFSQIAAALTHIRSTETADKPR